MISGDEAVVRADPTKAFFISILTKDIGIIDAILDLVDNSVDAAHTFDEHVPADGFFIKIRIGTDKFEIEDNCGGIEVHNARNYAFCFGRLDEAPSAPGSIGRFGVGMKRALFKLGSEFGVVSVARESSFSLDVNVDEWASEATQSQDWQFEFADFHEDEDHPAEMCGTTITVSHLHSEVASYFEGSAESELLSSIALRHRSAVREGIRIHVNDRLVPASPLELLHVHDTLVPINRQWEMEHIKFHLIAGIVPTNDDDDLALLGDGEHYREPTRAGW